VSEADVAHRVKHKHGPCLGASKAEVPVDAEQVCAEPGPGDAVQCKHSHTAEDKRQHKRRVVMEPDPPQRDIQIKWYTSAGMGSTWRRSWSQCREHHVEHGNSSLDTRNTGAVAPKEAAALWEPKKENQMFQRSVCVLSLGIDAAGLMCAGIPRAEPPTSSERRDARNCVIFSYFCRNTKTTSRQHKQTRRARNHVEGCHCARCQHDDRAQQVLGQHVWACGVVLLCTVVWPLQEYHLGDPEPVKLVP